ncbi:MAG: ribosome biogenesis GTP-binding protein YihA/YsxC [Pseudomonadota bacterium]
MIDPPTETEDALETGRHLFAQACDFRFAVAEVAQMPAAGLPEVAFAGRSNVGKSSLINALTGRKTLARTSNTPGRTQQLIFFDLGRRLTLVDLPGYGYAKVSKSLVARWTKLLRAYLRGRVTLRRAYVLIDARHGPKATDEEIMALLDQSAVPYRIVLTKIDKVSQADLDALVASLREDLKRHPAALPEPLATSAAKSLGLDQMRADVATLANEPAPPG